jgi:hypothetical protein
MLVSDKDVNELIPKERGSCLFQLEKYTYSEEKAFVVFSRKEKSTQSN